MLAHNIRPSRFLTPLIMSATPSMDSPIPPPLKAGIQETLGCVAVGGIISTTFVLVVCPSTSFPTNNTSIQDLRYHGLADLHLLSAVYQGPYCYKATGTY